MAKAHAPKSPPVPESQASPDSGADNEASETSEASTVSSDSFAELEARLVRYIDDALASKIGEIEARAQRGTVSLAQELESLGLELRGELRGMGMRLGATEKALVGVEAGVAHTRVLTAEETAAVISVDPSASFDVMADWQARFSPQRFHRGQVVRADQVNHLPDLVGAGLKLVVSDPERDERIAAMRSASANEAAAKHIDALRERAEREAAAAAATKQAADAAAETPAPPNPPAPTKPRIAEGPGARPEAPVQPRVAEGPGARAARQPRAPVSPAAPRVAEGPAAARGR